MGLEIQPSPMTENLMDNQTALLVINPVSGVSQPDIIRSRFERLFHNAGWNTQVYQTTGSEILADVVREHLSGGVNMVVAAGGDGTISEVGSSLTYTGIPLGILPTGTWNALSHNLGIPIFFEDAMHLLLKPHRLMKMDSLEVNGRHYLLNVGIGLSSAVIQSTRRHQKRRFGFLAYVWNFLAQASGLRKRTYRLGIDGREIKVRATELMVVNSSIIGFGELPTVLDIQPDDGRVEIIALRAPTIFGLGVIAVNILVGRRRKTPGFVSFTSNQKITIRSSRQVVVQADGEIIGHTPVEIILHHSAVDVIVPQISKKGLFSVDP